MEYFLLLDDSRKNCYPSDQSKFGSKSACHPRRKSRAAVRSLQFEELMPESQDLCMKYGSIPKALPNGVEQREDDSEHGIRKL